MQHASGATPRSGRFVIQGPPLPNEALRGYMLRLVEANCLSGPGVFQLKGDFLVPRCLASLPAIAEGGGVGLEALRSLYGSGGNSWRAQIGASGDMVPLRFLHARRAKVCPRCIEECRFIPAVWELGLVAACPIHGCEMLWECPGCGKSIDWRRRSIAFCCEDAPFESASTAAADSGVADLARAIGRMVDPRSPAPSVAVRGGVRSLGLEELLTLVIHVGSVGTDLLRARASTWGKSVIEPILVRAASVLLRWPLGMPAFVRLVAGTSDFVPTVSSREVLGIWAKRLWKELGGATYGFFREEFWRQLNVLAPGVAAARRSSDVVESMVSAGEASELFSVTRFWLEAWTASGRIASAVYPAGTSVRRMYSRSDIADLLREVVQARKEDREGELPNGWPFPNAVSTREGCVSVDQAAAVLGISSAAVAVLATKGLLGSHEDRGVINIPASAPHDLLIAVRRQAAERRPLRKGEALGRRETAIGSPSTDGSVLASRVEAVLGGSLTCVDRRRGVGLGAFAIRSAELGAEPPAMRSDRSWLTRPETAAALGCSKRAIEALLGAGLIREAVASEGGAQRTGRHELVRIDSSSVAAFQAGYILGSALLKEGDRLRSRRTKLFRKIARSRGSPVLDTQSIKVWKRLPDEAARF